MMVIYYLDLQLIMVVPPPTIRDKLRTKLHFKEKSKEKNRNDSSMNSNQGFHFVMNL